MTGIYHDAIYDEAVGPRSPHSRRPRAAVAPLPFGGPDGDTPVVTNPDGPDGDQVVEVLCWCEESLVRVPLTEWRSGLTASCWRQWCRPTQRDLLDHWRLTRREGRSTRCR